MALSEKEKEKIVEEEELRFRTRQRLKAESGGGCSCGHGGGCGCGRRHGWLWTIVGIVVLAGIIKCMVFCHLGHCGMGRGPMGPGCRMWGGPQEPAVPGPAQEAPAPMQKPVKK